ncbi:hypothetical protein NDU88_001976 [Pleurodeles waltl]|uniref:Uncharacterized protein n=1 Tax=Pleurodeles waltl TaxID=8319 RepID=A0AAV7W1W6_PLEWA|nr:hypothetical protein NDU88_001976 [Pleurodeles waltl]
MGNNSATQQLRVAHPLPIPLTFKGTGRDCVLPVGPILAQGLKHNITILEHPWNTLGDSSRCLLMPKPKALYAPVQQLEMEVRRYQKKIASNQKKHNFTKKDVKEQIPRVEEGHSASETLQMVNSDGEIR